tara:strand:+ start:108 stop:701 length:594 start_codon:yes stop_codon:yes gene_type:complete
MEKYKNVQHLFKNLPDTVLLVGNGKIDKKAELIDSYEFVIRFNDFQIDGYEEHVGTKVSAISFHCSDFTLPHTKYMLPNFEKYVDNAHLFTTSDIHGISKKEILHSQSSTRLFNVSHKYIDEVGGRLSSGTSLALNLSIFFDRNVHLIGFDGYESGHYYDETFSVVTDALKANINGPAHNSTYEFSLLKNLKKINFV